jgi:hypothetical protein
MIKGCGAIEILAFKVQTVYTMEFLENALKVECWYKYVVYFPTSIFAESTHINCAVE